MYHSRNPSRSRAGRACGALVSLVWCLLLAASSAEAQTSATYRNPVVAGDYPDPSVIRVGRDYWATTTSGTWSPHFPLLHSRDLVNWRVVGSVFQRRPRWAARDFWAPEITADRGRYYVYYTARRDDGPGKKGTLCVAVATAPRPSGPYTDHGPLVCQDIGSIDAFATRDERGRRFLIWKEDGNDRQQPTPIWAQRLTEDGLRLVGRPVEILRNDAPWERHVVEGTFIIRRNGWFYHFYSGNACCGRECNYALGVARSRRLLGPWEKHPSNPILAANQQWQCPGHGSIVTDTSGRDYLLYHSYRRGGEAFHIGREALLDEIKWNADGWPSINDGRGPSSQSPAPLGVAENSEMTTLLDEFGTRQLGPVWQWPMFNEQSATQTATGMGSFLVLAPRGAGRGDEWTGAVVARPSVSGRYEATTRLDARGLPKGLRAGLAAYGWRTASLGIASGDGQVFVWRRKDTEERTLATAKAPASPFIYLRMTADNGSRYQFAFSPDGRRWENLGGWIDGTHIEGVRVALTAGTVAGVDAAATGGSVGNGDGARFDWLRVVPMRVSTLSEREF